MKSSGLGRGLSSLIQKKETPTAGAAQAPSPVQHTQSLGIGAVVPPPPKAVPRHEGVFFEVAIGLVDPNPRQPRHVIEDEALQDLVASIREHGVLQPLLVTRHGERYELIAGERRLRASKLAGRATVPVILHADADDQEKLELALIENIQRADLNPIEEALAYRDLMDEFQLTQEEVGKRVGKSRPVVGNTVRLLQLPSAVQQALRERTIGMGQARALLALPSAKDQLALFQKMTSEKMTTRDVEHAVTEERVTKIRRDPNLLAYENDLRGALGTKVRITEKAGKGKIIIEYFSREDLLALKKKLGSE